MGRGISLWLLGVPGEVVSLLEKGLGCTLA